ncbi:protein of unknown function [Candidatus Hydrogenisulfobacillus filiaventi]|uniref:Uncharacterized protein n=1 Tax=Candidatus Hydrogenisulfobacillus filiaventi TaxID=2707344 RepID=A0A6F8ZIV6_9FIRM|nr:hypothetical protein [Bacillota bacterium]CAB1129872.1 protein of unknown function [Candidatus Hydrogenisulfobacillus filiaventi]
MAAPEDQRELLALMRWGLKFHRARRPRTRRQARDQVLALLARRFARCGVAPDGIPGGLPEALWRGAALAARSRVQAWRTRPPVIRFLWRFLLGLAGRATVLGILAAYRCWAWTRPPRPARRAALDPWTSGGRGQPG